MFVKYVLCLSTIFAGIIFSMELPIDSKIVPIVQFRLFAQKDCVDKKIPIPVIFDKAGLLISAQSGLKYKLRKQDISVIEENYKEQCQGQKRLYFLQTKLQEQNNSFIGVKICFKQCKTIEELDRALFLLKYRERDLSYLPLLPSNYEIEIDNSCILTWTMTERHNSFPDNCVYLLSTLGDSKIIITTNKLANKKFPYYDEGIEYKGAIDLSGNDINAIAGAMIRSASTSYFVRVLLPSDVSLLLLVEWVGVKNILKSLTF